MIRLFLLSVLAAVAILLAFGCSDDNCPQCPIDVDTVTLIEQLTDTITDTLVDTVAIGIQKVRVAANVRLWGDWLILEGWLEGVGGPLPDIDSVTLRGQRAVLEASVTPTDAYWLVYQAVYGGGLVSGDLAEVIVYTPDGSGTCRGDLLHYETDSVAILSHSRSYPYDTVDLDTDIEVVWSSVPRADWYACSAYFLWEEDGYYYGVWVSDYYTNDTSVIIPAALNTADGEWEVDVFAITGPHPEDDEGNFLNPGVVDGTIHSYTMDWVYIEAGTGLPAGAPVDRSKDNGNEVLDRILGKPGMK